MRTHADNGQAADQKRILYGNYLAARKRRSRIYEEAARMALDLPAGLEDDDVNIVRQTSAGFGWKELLALAAAGVAAIVAWQLAAPEPSQQLAPAPAAAPAYPGPPDSDYEVRFFDAEGNPIHVPHISEKPIQQTPPAAP